MALALVAGAGVTGFWWKPWQSVTLPQSACWGELGPADYQLLAGPDGSAKASERGTLDGPVSTGVLMSSCRLVWNDRDRSSMLSVAVGSADETDGAEDPRLLGNTLQAVDFGADAQGWIAQGTGPLAVQFPCTYQGTGKTSPFIRIVVSSADLGTASTDRVRAAYAAVALKMAKAVAQRLPCSNALHLPDQVAVLPG
ncbi:hypothetical protein [Kitasatospora sp. LaBMicrA B282]|uniref:hypothetical protein n=1 Tax=Kitasatospora sp. LaBMicrA B282 TaxID=3420949 RepID=UPI003D0DF2BE